MASSDLENAQSKLPELPKVTIPNLQEVSADTPTSPATSDHQSVQTISTATYERQEQEAEELFRRRIEKLCHDLWPPSKSIKHRFLASHAATRLRTNSLLRSMVPEPQTPIIEHLKGGGFNYITAITLPPSYAKEGQRDLILRVPREDESRPDHQVATLDFVRKQTSLPVPTIAAADFTCNNALEKPYVLQYRIPGKDLDSVWNELSHPQRRIVAQEVGRTVKTLLSIESPRAGIIQTAGQGSDTTLDSPDIVPWKLESQGEVLEELQTNDALMTRPPGARSTTLDFFETYLGRWRKHALAESLGEVDSDVELYDNLVNIAREMDDLGLFKPDINCLCHLDLHPRNIMVQAGPNDSLKITAILDWDEAVVAPKFFNCQPPGWLWGYDKDTHVDEDDLLPWPYELEGANKEPATSEQQELKLIFEENAGSEYPRLAYETSSRFIRTLIRLATLGLTANWHSTAAERIVKEWKSLRPSLGKA